MSMIDAENASTMGLGLFVVLCAGAISVGVLGVADFHVLVDGLDMEDPTIGYVLVGVAGVLGLTEAFGYTEVLDD